MSRKYEICEEIDARIKDISEAAVPGCRYTVNHHLKVLIKLIQELLKDD